MRLGCLLLMGVLTSSCYMGAESNAPLLMPMPAHVQSGNGTFPIQQIPALEFRGAGAADARVKHAAERFLANLARRTNLGPADGPASFVIACTNGGEKVQVLGEDESYRLEVTPTEVHLDAATPLGV